MQHPPSHKEFQEKNGYVSSCKMLPSEVLVRTAGTEHDQFLRLKHTSCRKKKKKSCFLNKSQKALEPHIPDTISVMLSSAEAEPTEI